MSDRIDAWTHIFPVDFNWPDQTKYRTAMHDFRR